MSRLRVIHSLAITVVATILLTLYRLAVTLPRGSQLDHVSGVWAAMALDTSQGVFYRPLFASEGYGGTRFFPLFFTVHAGLIKVLGYPVATGYALSLLSMAALILGVFYLLRGLGVAASLAACAAVLTLATAPAQLALTTIRGDALPAALNVWGLVLVQRGLREGGSTLPPGLLFALACLAKVTTVFGLAAGCLALYRHGRRRAALVLLLTAVTTVAAGVALTHAASEGRFLESMSACSSGEATVESLLTAPWSLINIASYGSPFDPLVLALSAVGAIRGWGKNDLATLAFVFTLGLTVLIFGSKGINYNHLLDLFTIGLVVFAVQVGHGRINFLAGTLSLTVVGALLLCGSFNAYRAADRRDNIALYREVARESMQRGGGPLLSENPWFSIFAGERPFMLDPFMFRLLSRKDPRFAEDLHRKLEERYFRSVILSKPPDVRDEAYWYRNVHFGPGFIWKLTDNYSLSQRNRGASVYSPMPVH